ncbi:MAG: TraR/DksA family transcriptional regulator [Candidatus Babeliales bacterium]
MKQRIEVLEKIKNNLHSRKLILTNQITEQTMDKITDGQILDVGDEALSISMEKIQSSLQKTEMDELRLIDHALTRLERNEFGVCVDCGDAISDRRLENFPYAARCIVCQEEFEQ